MPIFMDGKVYEDQAHLEAAFSPMLKDMGVDVKPLPPQTGDDVDPKMVVTPNEMQTNKELEAQDDEVLGGIEIGFKQPLGSPTEPAGALKSTEGAQTPDIDWSRLNQPFGSIKGTAPEDTPVLFKTKAGNITEGDITRGIDIALSAGPGMIVSAKAGLGMDFWKKSFQAAHMERAGATPDEVLKATGLFKKGPTGRWVTELSDEGLSLVDKDWKFGEAGKLSDFVNHPKLFEAYPELKDVNFKVAEKDYEWLGGFSRDSNTLTINPKKIPAGDEGLLDVIAHEIQHWVQVKEGFPAGSNPNQALRDAIWALGNKMQQTPEGPAKVEMQKLMVDIANNDKRFAEYMYQRVPGEVEANVTMARRKLSDQQRELFPIEEFKKFMEGSANTLSGGKYYPEFHYPK
jgi:hypothetical protein